MPVWTNLPIKWKLTAIFLLLALIPTGATFVSMNRIYTEGFLRQSHHDGENVLRFISSLIASSEDNLLQGVILLRHNEDLVLNAYLAMIGQPIALDETLQAALSVLSCDVVEMRNLKGEVLGRGANTDRDIFQGLDPNELKTAFETEESSLMEWVVTEDTIFLRQLAPMYYQGIHVGTLGAGVFLNNAFARRIAEAFGYEIAIFQDALSIAASRPEFAEATQPFLSSDADIGQTGEARMFPDVSIADRSYSLFVTPLLDHRQRPIGTLVVGFDEATLDAIQEQSQSSMLLMIAIIGLVLLGLAYWTSSISVRPLIRITNAARKIARGEITDDLPVKAGRDEIATLHNAFCGVVTYFQEISGIARRIADGDIHCSVQPRSSHDMLSHAFQRMNAYLQDMAAVVIAIADGDFRREIALTNESDQLGKAFQQLHSLRDFMRDIISTIEQLRDASAVLSQVSADIAAGADQVSQQTRVVSSNSVQINQGMLGVSSATEEMTANIREISRMTHEVSDIAHSAAEMTNSASMAIFALKTDSDEIGDIVKIINTIAEQTNLLALNATIEAARAGDSGRGFAVVAGEVKNLSRETTGAVENIIQKIDAIQSSSKQVTDSVVQLSDFIHRVHELSVSIASAIEEQTATTSMIARNISESANSNEDITHTITEVASATQQVSAQTIHMQEASEELTNLAEQLGQRVKKFQV